jgi:outer membrane protein
MTHASKAALVLGLAVALIPARFARSGEAPAPPAPPAEAVVDLAQIEAEDKGLELKPRTEPPIQLSLQQCVELALKNNIGLQIERLNPELRGAAVEIAGSAFDPTVGGTLNGGMQHQPSANGSPVRHTADGTAYISQRALSGGSYRIGPELYRSADSTHAANLALTLTQPLLQNFGFDVNRVGIDIAENELAIAESALIGQIIFTVADAHRAYWDLVLAYRQLDVQRVSLDQAAELLRENIVKMQMKVAIKTDVLQARATMASRRILLVQAESSIRLYEDNLKRLTNIAGNNGQATATWQQPLVPTTEAPFIESHPDELDAIRQAFENRTDYFSQKKRMENADIQLRFAKNQLYPQLDLTASASVNGTHSSQRGAIDSMAEDRFNRWDLGVVFSYPLGNRSRKNAYRQRQIEKEQALLNFKSLEQQIILDVRSAVRNIETDFRRVKAARIAVDSARANLEAAQEVKKEGGAGITTTDILQFQAELESASSNYLRSVVDYNKSLITLDQAMGTLLKTQNIDVKRE